METQVTKSILDGIEVKEHGFPLNKNCVGGTCKTEKLVIVGHCPDCGSPIYGPHTVTLTSGNAIVQYSCTCHSVTGKAFEATIHTK